MLSILLWSSQIRSSPVFAVPCKCELWGPNQPGSLSCVSQGSLPVVIERGSEDRVGKRKGTCSPHSVLAGLVCASIWLCPLPKGSLKWLLSYSYYPFRVLYMCRGQATRRPEMTAISSWGKRPRTDLSFTEFTLELTLLKLDLRLLAFSHCEKTNSFCLNHPVCGVQ